MFLDYMRYVCLLEKEEDVVADFNSRGQVMERGNWKMRCKKCE